MIAEQRYAFFAYTDELASKCMDSLNDEINWGFAPESPNLIRIRLDNMQYTFARSASKARQRPVLEPWVFDSLFLLPTHEARVVFITELYDEQANSNKQREAELDSGSKRLPWL